MNPYVKELFCLQLPEVSSTDLLSLATAQILERAADFIWILSKPPKLLPNRLPTSDAVVAK